MLNEYPYLDSKGKPFRLERLNEHCWNVFQPAENKDEEIQDGIIDCETLQEAIDCWTNFEE
jgi:hypothetical protein